MKSLLCFDRVVSVENLWQAWREYERGKRRRPGVATFGLDAERRVLALSRALSAGIWRPGPYQLTHLRDPKRRVVAAAPVGDRVVHRALYRVVAPWWSPTFIEHSYACIEERGLHRALLAFHRRALTFRHVLTLDVSRYFYRIDRERLRHLLFRRLPEWSLRRLMNAILESGAGLYQKPEVAEWLDWPTPGEPGRGLPIGNLASQWWANVYLDGLDHHLQRQVKVPAYQRYMDDLTPFGNDPTQLLRWREEAADWLKRERCLELKDPQAQPQSTRGSVLYLGHRVGPQGIRLGTKGRGRLPAHLRAKLDEPERLGQVVQSFAAAWMFGS